MRIQNLRNRCRDALLKRQEGFTSIEIDGLCTTLEHACVVIMVYDIAPKYFSEARKRKFDAPDPRSTDPRSTDPRSTDPRSTDPGSSSDPRSNANDL